MRARDWKRLVTEERDRLLEGAEEKRQEAERLTRILSAEARLMEESAEALDRVLKIADGDQQDDDDQEEDEQEEHGKPLVDTLAPLFEESDEDAGEPF